MNSTPTTSAAACRPSVHALPPPVSVGSSPDGERGGSTRTDGSGSVAPRADDALGEAAGDATGLAMPIDSVASRFRTGTAGAVIRAGESAYCRRRGLRTPPSAAPPPCIPDIPYDDVMTDGSSEHAGGWVIRG